MGAAILSKLASERAHHSPQQPLSLDRPRNLFSADVVAFLRRSSSGFSRGASLYRGVTRHHQAGKWEAR